MRPLLPPKRLLLLRHGQATHNPRAEAAREKGCSFDEFLRLMEEDDEFDAALTELGVDQAIEAGRRDRVRRALGNVDMVVSSPLSRALHTADLVHPPPPHPSPEDASKSKAAPAAAARRVCIEHFREINGKLLNARRLPRSELERKFPTWHFDRIPATDESWMPDDLESRDACGERGYVGLSWIMRQRDAERVLLVCHGGLLNYTLNDNPGVVLVDGRTTREEGEERERRCVTKRFGNCELREFVATVWDSDDSVDVDVDVVDSSPSSADGDDSGEGEDAARRRRRRSIITLEEVAMGEETEDNAHFSSEDDGIDDDGPRKLGMM